MEYIISNNRRVFSITILVGMVVFIIVGLSTAAIMTSVFGLKPGDVGYSNYYDPNTGQTNTPYQNFIVNGCFPKPHSDNDQIVIMDSKGLKELGLIWYDPNTCFDLAKTMTNYNIDNIDVDPVTNDMKITLVLK